MKLIKSSKILALIVVKANNNKVISGSSGLEPILPESKKIKMTKFKIIANCVIHLLLLGAYQLNIALGSTLYFSSIQL